MKKNFLKAFFIFFFGLIFLILTQIKFSPILGTKMHFSLAVFLGPTFAQIFGISVGTLIIIFSQIFGIFFGIFEFKNLSDIFLFFPIIFAGIFFNKILKKEKKILFLPLFSIFFFLLHPIGREVWFFTLFWIIPIILFFFKIPKLNLFSNSLSCAFVDHSVGSVIYLYLLNIPAHFWIQAIPLAIFERVFIGFGIGFCYSLEKIIIRQILKIPVFVKLKELVFV